MIMIPDYIANYQDFQRFRAVLDKIVPVLPKRLNLCMIEAAESQCRQSILDFLFGQSPAIQDLRKTIEKIAPGNHSILITGSSGTGKELIAQAIHLLSSRWDEPFFPLNCSTLDGLYASDLFGHEKGAFTDARVQRKGAFENVGPGTVFLDEIGELSPKIQAAMLRTLQEKTITRVGGQDIIPIHCRIIFATNRNLEEEVQKGSFRSDLYYRLIQGACVHSPDLSERDDDLILLTLFLIIRHLKEHAGVLAGTPDLNGPVTIRKSFIRALKSHDFSRGNIRELEGIVNRVMLKRETNILTGKEFLANAKPLVFATPHRQSGVDQRSVEKLHQLLTTKAGIEEEAKAHIARAIISFGKNPFTPKAFIEEMRRTHPLHDNTCREYLRSLNKWGILQRNTMKTKGSRYWLARTGPLGKA